MRRAALFLAMIVSCSVCLAGQAAAQRARDSVPGNGPRFTPAPRATATPQPAPPTNPTSTYGCVRGEQLNMVDGKYFLRFSVQGAPAEGSRPLSPDITFLLFPQGLRDQMRPGAVPVSEEVFEQHRIQIEQFRAAAKADRRLSIRLTAAGYIEELTILWYSPCRGIAHD
jgi:hypothetical protein